jgi:hypothetical protein
MTFPQTHSRLRRALASVLLAVLIAVAVAACGGGSSGSGIAGKPAASIAVAAGKALNKAKTVHVSGTVRSGGQSIAIDMSVVSGKGARGTMTLAGQPVQVVTVGPKLYLKAGTAFWKHYAGSFATLVAGKWLEVATATTGASSFAGLLNLHAVVGRLLAQATGNRGLTKGKQTTINGQNAIAVTQGGNALYVATSGTAYPLELLTKAGGHIFLSHYNEAVSLAAPSPVVKFPGA